MAFLPETVQSSVKKGVRDIKKIQNPTDFDEKPYLKSLMQSPDRLADQTMKGVEQSGLIADQTDMGPSDQAMGFNSGGLRQALSQRAAKAFDQDLSRIQSQAKMGAYAQSLKDKNAAEGYIQSKQRLEMARYRREKQIEQQKQAARAQALGSILQVGGTIGGAIIGGPAGAAVGGSVAGSMAPQMQTVGAPSQGAEYNAGLNPGQEIA